jgi:hypothetical protein
VEKDKKEFLPASLFSSISIHLILEESKEGEPVKLNRMLCLKIGNFLFSRAERSARPYSFRPFYFLLFTLSIDSTLYAPLQK